MRPLPRVQCIAFGRVPRTLPCPCLRAARWERTSPSRTRSGHAPSSGEVVWRACSALRGHRDYWRSGEAPTSVDIPVRVQGLNSAVVELPRRARFGHLPAWRACALGALPVIHVWRMSWQSVLGIAKKMTHRSCYAGTRFLYVMELQLLWRRMQNTRAIL